MKTLSLPALALGLAATTAMAVPPLPPKTTVATQSVADTLPPPSTSGIFGWPGLPPGTATWYRYLGLPVIAQSTPNDRLFAFPGRVNMVFTITAANDEGVFSNGPGYSATGSPAATVPVFAESSPLGPNFLGNLTPLQLAAGSTLTNPSVERLQISSNGIVACQTFSNSGGNVFREGIAANNGLLSLGAASAILPMTARQPGVMDDDCQNIAAREQWLAAPAQRVNRFRFPGGTGVPMNPLPLSTNLFVASGLPTPLGGSWWATQGAVGRLGSPSISAAGVVAAHCIDNVGTPFKRPQIRIEDPFGTQAIVMRQGTNCGANPMGANFFGVVNSSLMALNIRSASGGNKEVIAWQMTNMRTAPNSGIIAQPSLWCRQMSLPPTCTYITHGGGVVPAPLIPGYFFNTFYALHVTEDPTNPSISKVVFGVNLVPASVPQKRAIYSCDISGGVVVAGSLLPIATNVPGITPLLPWSGGTDNIATFGTPAGTSGHLFSVSRGGDVLFKATLGTNITAPAPTAAQRQVLVVASPTTSYALQVWAQSGLTTFTSMGGATATFSNFSLTQPDQGTYSRGQGIATLPGTSGTLSPNIIFRGHAGAAHAIILAN